MLQKTLFSETVFLCHLCGTFGIVNCFLCHLCSTFGIVTQLILNFRKSAPLIMLNQLYIVPIEYAIRHRFFGRFSSWRPSMAPPHSPYGRLHVNYIHRCQYCHRTVAMTHERSSSGVKCTCMVSILSLWM